jgi:hypothetical protein
MFQRALGVNLGQEGVFVAMQAEKRVFERQIGK